MRKKVLGLALSMVVGVSVLGVTAFAETRASGCNHHSSCIVNSSNEISCVYASQSQHCVTVSEEHFCYGCQDYHDYVGEYYEDHDYDLNEATGMIECSGCGDSYAW